MFRLGRTCLLQPATTATKSLDSVRTKKSVSFADAKMTSMLLQHPIHQQPRTIRALKVILGARALILAIRCLSFFTKTCAINHGSFVFFLQLCLAYGSELKRRGYCLTSEGCAPGCIEHQDTDSQQTSFRNRGCLPGRFWRDERTCVPASDCNCRTPYGKIIAPGSIDESEDSCEVCQCLDNEYICDNSRCQYSWTTPAIEGRRNISHPHNTETASSRPDDVAVILFCLVRLDQRVREYSRGRL